MGRIGKRQKKSISVIIPAFKQQRTITRDILHIKQVMKELRYNFEIIVVVDGFVDKTFQNAKKISSKYVSVVGYKHNRGKGYAVRYGMARAKGNIIAFIDSGMDIKPNGLALLLEHFEWYKAEIIIGSKLHPVSKVNYPASRKVLSWGYRTLVKLLFGLSVRDTQTGIKFFKRKVLEDVLPRLIIKTYAFDIEILAVAYRIGYRRIFEAPIELNFKGASSITSKSFWKVVMLMLWDTLAVFYRLKILRYYDNGNKRRWKYDAELNFKINLT